MQIRRANLGADRRKAEAECIEYVCQHQRGKQHRIDTRETAHQEVAGIEGGAWIGEQLARRSAMNTVPADHEEDRHAGRTPGNGEGEIAEDRVEVEPGPGPVELLYADPGDLAAVKISDQQCRETTPRVDGDIVVV